LLPQHYQYSGSMVVFNKELFMFSHLQKSQILYNPLSPALLSLAHTLEVALSQFHRLDYLQQSTVATLMCNFVIPRHLWSMLQQTLSQSTHSLQHSLTLITTILSLLGSVVLLSVMLLLATMPLMTIQPLSTLVQTKIVKSVLPSHQAHMVKSTE
jgi:hypothetical protein